DDELVNELDPKMTDVHPWPSPGIMYYYLLGKESNFFELGAGMSVSPMPWKSYGKNDSATSIHGCIGYRYQKSNGLLFRVGFTPFYRINWAFLPLGGVSLGYSW
ncbi:MAG: hypothetical protein OEX22_07465, partial [Cyclobacteriaceae bacterium]|nr:hypothetical protein [Cyclobacteriaceae bacterium]